MFIATKLGRVVTYNEEFPSMKSQDPLISRLREKVNTLYLYYHMAYDHYTW